MTKLDLLKVLDTIKSILTMMNAIANLKIKLIFLKMI